MGAFLPWFRNHYIRKGKKLFQEPYAYQDVIGQVPDEYKLMYESVLPVCKYYIELRYRLLQLFYDAMWENALRGLPICIQAARIQGGFLMTIICSKPQKKSCGKT